MGPGNAEKVATQQLKPADARLPRRRAGHALEMTRQVTLVSELHRFGQRTKVR
jgi:hypothetical protein